MNAADHDEAGPAIGRTDASSYATQEHDSAPTEADASADRSHAAELLGSEALRLDKGDLFRRIARNLDAFRQDSSWARSRSQTETEGGDPPAGDPENGENPSTIAALGARVEAMGQSLDALQRSVAPRLAQVQNAELAPLQALVDAVVGEMNRLKRRPPVAPMAMFGAEMGAGALPAPMAGPSPRPVGGVAAGPEAAARPALASDSTGPVAEAQRIDDPDTRRRRAGGSTLRRALIGVAWAVPVVLSGTVLVQHYLGSFTETGIATSHPSARPEALAPGVTTTAAPVAPPTGPRAAPAAAPVTAPVTAPPAASPAAAAPTPPPVPVASISPPPAVSSPPPASPVALPAAPITTAPSATSVQRTEPPAPPAAQAQSAAGTHATAVAGSHATPARSAGAAASPASTASAPDHREAEGLTPRSWVDWSPTKSPAASRTNAPSSGPKVIGPAGSASVAQVAPAVSTAAAPVSSTPTAAPIASPAVDTAPAGVAASSPPAAKHPAASPAPSRAAAATPATGPLQIRTTADAWVQVHDAKGAVVFGRLMRAGESWTVPDQPGLLLTTGNAGGTELVIGGVASAPLGAPGVVRHDVPLSGAGLRAIVPASHGGATSG